MKKMKFVLLSTLLLTSGLFTSCNSTSKVDVMIVGVDHIGFKETDILIDELTSKNKKIIDNKNFYTGKIGNKSVVVAETLFGMPDAAMVTTIGIKNFHPKYVINEGTAGGHHSNVHVNDVVLGKEILDTSSYEGDAAHPKNWVKLQNPTLYGDETLLEKVSNVKNPYGNIEKDGIIASSDAWNESTAFINELNERFHEDCEEMESYAVTRVSNNYKIPSIAIRIISNNSIIGEKYTEEAGKNVQRYTIDVIKAI